MKHVPRPFAWIMVILASALLVRCIALIVTNPGETGPWLTGLSLVITIGLFASALVPSRDK